MILQLIFKNVTIQLRLLEQKKDAHTCLKQVYASSIYITKNRYPRTYMIIEV